MLEPSEQLDIIEDSYIRGQANIVAAWEKARPVLEYLINQAFEEGRRTAYTTQPAKAIDFKLATWEVKPFTATPAAFPAGTIFSNTVPATTASAAPEHRLATAQEIIEANADKPLPPGHHKPSKYPASEVTRL